MSRLDEMTFSEAAAVLAREPIVLIPVGATEAHGPHLPLGTDVVLSEELARRTAAALATRGRAVVIAPSIAYSLTDYAGPFAGTISISAETAARLVNEVCTSLIAQGFDKVCLINNHLEPAHVTCLTDACARTQERTGRMVAFPDQTARRWARTLSDEYKRGACHAGSYETSLVLAARPELVRQAVRAALAPVPIDLVQAMKAGARTFAEAGAADAYFGDPAAATAAEGDDLYARLVTMILTTIDETWT